MSMHGGGGAMGGPARMGMRSMRQDRKILDHEIKKGTLRRMFIYARPYRSLLIIFLIAVILGAVVASVTPLILKQIIDEIYAAAGSSSKGGSVGHYEQVVIWLSVLTAVLAIVDAVLSMFERRISAVIGESLIYDMRAEVFAHIQAMPIAFFSRTQTGALISRLNNDVIGAQQAFTDLFSNVVGNVILTVIVLIASLAGRFFIWRYGRHVVK